MAGRRGGRVLLGALGCAVILQAALYFAYRRTEKARQPRIESREVEVLRNASRMPAVELERRDGSIDSLTATIGRPTILHFWATWCPPCREELPALLDLARRLDRSGEMRVVAIATDPDWSAVDSFLADGVTLHVRRDPGQRAVRALGVTTLPDTYVIDAEGRVRLRLAGARNWSDPTLIAQILRSTL
jgi:thiol-disulfide isomerase/thioredoxin